MAASLSDQVLLYKHRVTYSPNRLFNPCTWVVVMVINHALLCFALYTLAISHVTPKALATESKTD